MENLLVGLSVYRSVSPETTASLLALIKALPDVKIIIKSGCDLAYSRQKISEHISNEDYLLCLDGDMSFTLVELEKLYSILSKRKSIGALSGLYVKWKDGTPVCNWKRPDNSWLSDKEKSIKATKLISSSSVEEVDSFGGGFLLIDTEVFKKISSPYFSAGWDKFGYYDCDTGFCQTLKRFGYHPSVHFGASVTHIGPTSWSV